MYESTGEGAAEVLCGAAVLFQLSGPQRPQLSNDFGVG